MRNSLSVLTASVRAIRFYYHLYLKTKRENKDFNKLLKESPASKINFTFYAKPFKLPWIPYVFDHLPLFESKFYKIVFPFISCITIIFLTLNCQENLDHCLISLSHRDN